MTKRILQARISEEMYDKLSQKAKKHRVTVSNLVRNLVEDAIELQDDVTQVADKVIRDVLVEKKVDRQNVIGYQEITLNSPKECSFCAAPIKKGEKASIALFDDLDKKAIVCHACRKS